MARRPRAARAENLADFAGPDPDQDAIETLAAAARKENAKKKNTGEVTDETVGMHVNLIKAAELQWREARDRAAELQGVLRNRYKVAKQDGIDIDALKLAFRIAERNSGEVVAEQRSVGRYLRVMGVELGHQWAFQFDEPGNGASSTMEPELQGQAAWRNNEPRTNNPFTQGTEQFVAWDQGWSNAQAHAARSMGTSSEAAH